MSTREMVRGIIRAQLTGTEVADQLVIVRVLPLRHSRIMQWCQHVNSTSTSTLNLITLIGYNVAPPSLPPSWFPPSYPPDDGCQDQREIFNPHKQRATSLSSSLDSPRHRTSDEKVSQNRSLGLSGYHHRLDKCAIQDREMHTTAQYSGYCRSLDIHLSS